MNFDDYESLPTSNVTSHMTAGAAAGIMEHCVMFPLDSVKTRMQSLAAGHSRMNTTIREVLGNMVREEGLSRPFKGVQIVFMGAGPAHAMYFATYEYMKEFYSSHLSMNGTIASGIAGVTSTLLHDGVMTPSDAVKQRLQMFNSPYRGVFDCIRRVHATQGIAAFYRSYTTQLTMNIPFQSIHFMTYEVAQNITNPSREYNPAMHMVSGALAGGIAAAITTPLDVCKTLLNTQSEANVRGLTNAVRAVYRLGGPLGFFKGLSPRVLYQMPSTAICWSTYEFFKWFLLNKKEEESQHSDKKVRELPTLSPASLYAVPVAFSAQAEPSLIEVTRS
uniref:Mitoferrin-1 n=1 Tax=Lygus hesperus TaxID=30085 RepID=A0A0A9ZHV2_LYGHE